MLTETTAHATTAPWDIARAVARHLLVPTPREAVAIAPDAWDAVADLLATQRCSGLALRAAADGVLELTEVQYAALLTQHEMQLALDLRVERLVLDAFAALTAAGIDARLLKGPAVAHRFYDDPALRSFGDADILVPRAQFRGALAALGRLGFHRTTRTPRSWFDRYVKAACLVGEHGMQIDLHQLLADGPYGYRFDPGALLREPADEIVLGTAPIPCLPPAAAFVHACMHAALGDPAPRLMSLRDVVEVLRAQPPLTHVTELVSTCALEPVVARAVSLVETELGVPVRGEIGDRYRAYRPNARDRWRLAPYLSPGSRFARQSATAFWELPAFDRAAYATALAFPSRAYLRDRGTTHLARLRRAVAYTMRSRPR